MQTIIDAARSLASLIDALPMPNKIEALNVVRCILHEASPFRAEPVDCVTWEPCESVVANDYNPNKVASPEMALLHISIKEDGYTQPIVAFRNNRTVIVVDGFHRRRVGTEKSDIRKRVCGYLPIVEIRKNLHDRMASTVRHNRARGKHQVELMSAMIVKLAKLGMTDGEIAKQLGMTADELIRLKAQTGIAKLFEGQPYSRSWIAFDGDSDDKDDEVSPINGLIDRDTP